MACVKTAHHDVSIAHVLETLDQDGAIILENAMSSELLAQANAELHPFIASGQTGRDEFGGYKTKRIGALIARSPACRQLALDPQINAICTEFLKPFCDGYQLHFTQAVSIGPEETGQMLHRDRGVWGGYISRKIETQLSTIWAANDFTHANGATRVVPGSHKWAADRRPEPHEIASAEMRAGSVLVYTGSVIHGGGANETDANRIGILLHYAPSWLRQEENQYLSCPPDVAKTLSPDLRALIGYTKGGHVLGFFSAPTRPDEEGPELAPPERLFSAAVDPFEIAISARELVEKTS